MSSLLRQWMQNNQVFDKDLFRLFPKYGVNDPEKDLKKLSEEKWTEIQNLVLNEKMAELKDNAANLRFKKKINKITKIWKEQKKKNNNNNNDDEKNELEQLRLENRRIRRELSTKNSDCNRLHQEFNLYKKQKEDEIKKLNNKYNTKNEEYEKLLKQYKSINQRINSKYHDNSAKDKEIKLLKTDKSILLNDINEVMKSEQEKYDILLTKYNELKAMNNRNLKYKLRYKKEKNRQNKHRKRGNNYTIDLNVVDIDKINGISDNEIDSDLMAFEYYRPKKYKPSKQKRSRARQMSEIVTTRSKPQKKKNQDI